MGGGCDSPISFKMPFIKEENEVQVQEVKTQPKKLTRTNQTDTSMTDRVLETDIDSILEHTDDGILLNHDNYEVKNRSGTSTTSQNGPSYKRIRASSSNSSHDQRYSRARGADIWSKGQWDQNHNQNTITVKLTSISASPNDLDKMKQEVERYRKYVDKEQRRSIR